MTKRVCISGYYGFDNFGDETILKILVDNIRENVDEITVFSVNPQKTEARLKVKSVNTFNIKEILYAILKCNCLISGGGSLLQDVTSVNSLIYYLFVIISAQILGKKTIIFAQGIGPINNLFLKYLTMLVLKRAIYVTVRDENSYKLLQKHGIQKLEKCVDPVWNIEVREQAKTSKVGVQLREFSFVTDEFIYKMAKNINRYYANREISILSLQNKQDLNVSRKLMIAIIGINPEIKVKIVENTSNEKVIKDISELNTLIAMRYHACLVGIKQGVKVLPINYDIKVEQLAKDFNLVYFNTIGQMDRVFENFYSCDINYDKEKIREFDFKKIKEIL